MEIMILIVFCIQINLEISAWLNKLLRAQKSLCHRECLTLRDVPVRTLNQSKGIISGVCLDGRSVLMCNQHWLNVHNP